MAARAATRFRTSFIPAVLLAVGVGCGGGGEEVDAVDPAAPVELDPAQLPRRAAPAPADGTEPARSEASTTLARSNAAPESAAAGALECEDTCASKRAECGFVCDESCGECGDGEGCEDGKCVCQSSCDGTRCTDDCGRPCACPFGTACNAGGFCVALDGCGDAPCPTELVPPTPPPAPPVPPAF